MDEDEKKDYNRCYKKLGEAIDGERAHPVLFGMITLMADIISEKSEDTDLAIEVLVKYLKKILKEKYGKS